MSKAKALIRHAKRRADIRYGTTLSNQDLENIVRLSQQQKGVFKEKQSNRVSHWEVEYKGILFRAVYDRQRKKIITFLPLEQNGQY
ncbi:MAG: hypothetical protein NTW46_03965 [Candidatus Nealsonbacteria bacterium]|nr:hypothetical protein [Candidatus Nealsonbacteria bacterium]